MMRTTGIVLWSSLVAIWLIMLLAPPRTVEAQGSGGVAWYNQCAVVTPSDTADFAQFTQAGVLTGLIYVGGTGTMTVVDQAGATTLFSAIPVAAQFQIGVRRINATGTTATLIVACWRR
jgi:hypothetical protein